MRSQRYKYVRHCASDCLIAHTRAGYHTYGGSYSMLTRGKCYLKPMEIYRWRNQRWWWTVHRWDWRFISSDIIGYTKWRCADKYEMHNFNYEY